jgi:hypothetical protein
MKWEEQERSITKNVRRAWQDIEDRKDLVFKQPTQSKQRLICQAWNWKWHVIITRFKTLKPCALSRLRQSSQHKSGYVPHRSQSTLILTQFQFCVKCITQGISTSNSCNFVYWSEFMPSDRLQRLSYSPTCSYKKNDNRMWDQRFSWQWLSRPLFSGMWLILSHCLFNNVSSYTVLIQGCDTI